MLSANAPLQVATVSSSKAMDSGEASKEVAAIRARHPVRGDLDDSRSFKRSVRVSKHVRSEGGLTAQNERSIARVDV